MSSVDCFHCGQRFPTADKVEHLICGSIRDFCCHGCAGVCESIYDSGLESFYQRTLDGDTLSPPPPPSPDIEFYDYDDVQSQFVNIKTSIREITLVSEGIHCAACIWLIENTLAKLDNILFAKVNFTNRQIKIRWDNGKIKLSDIIKRLNQIGYDVRPYDATSSEEAFRKANRELLYRLGFAGFAMMNIMWFSVALYTGATEDQEFRQYFNWLQLIIATFTLIYSGKPFLTGAWQSLKAKNISMDVSISLGILITYFYSAWVTVSTGHSGSVYFDTLIDFMFLLLIGRYLETIFKNKAIDASHRLADLQPKVARMVLEHGIEIVPIRRLQPGDKVQIKPGDKISVDGKVFKGESNVNESMLSGESNEVYKKVGMNVSAGTHNLDGELIVIVENTLHKTILGKIISLVEEAQVSKAKVQCTAEKIIPWFVSITVSLAVLSFSYWYLQAGFEKAMIAATSVLIITCPCAFGLATPMAMAVATGVSSRFGILIKNSGVLEELNKVNHFIFDKTGTLTLGHMKVVNQVFIPKYQKLKKSILTEVYFVESLSEHSLAKAIVKHISQEYKDIHTNKLEVDNFKSHPGKGVEGIVNNNHYIIGTQKWLGSYSIDLPTELIEVQNKNNALGQTSVCIVRNKQLIGILFLEDELRNDAKELIQRIKSKGHKVTLLSGDKKIVCEVMAKRLGEITVITEVLPEDKYLVVKKLQDQGDRVAMVGDGINDAPALVQADVSFALGSGTEVSIDSSDVVLLNNELLAVDTATQLSKRTIKTIKQNIASSIIYNIIMVPMAMAAVLTPLIAAITMPLSSLLVIGNSSRIIRFYSSKAIKKRRKG